jgi:hypothetical protein
LIGGKYEKGMSRADHAILALQAINRLNHVVGRAAITKSKPIEEMRLLQIYVNNLTLGVKRDSNQEMKNALAGVRELVKKGV